ncbi:DUF1510 family protein [Virgibacillus flavescens]|uniref:YrrS family protein n=1 Tax=Virgibacillus flavescens TaxID=1611422 RepID=UPI003D3573B5
MDNNSRLNKFEKRRKNTKSISLFLVAGGILLIVLLAMFFFGGGEEKTNEEQPSTDTKTEGSNNNSADENNESKNEPVTEENDEEASDENSNTEDDAASDDSSSSNDEATDDSDTQNENPDQDTNEDESTNSDIERETVEGSDNPNVLETYTADWEPIGTEQEGTHTKQFAEGTQDRKEMEEAIRVATGLKQGDMITWWLDNGGGNKVIATASNKVQDQTYRVYLTWVENEGWKPTKVEVLKENDKD